MLRGTVTATVGGARLAAPLEDGAGSFHLGVREAPAALRQVVTLEDEPLGIGRRHLAGDPPLDPGSPWWYGW